MRLRQLATTAALAAGIIATGAACNDDAAQAAPAESCHRVHQSTGNGYGILNNTQVYLPIDLGLNVTDNALGILGFANAAGSTHNTRIDCGN